ncbi:MAG TPA: hypothetical protein VFP52_06370 [Myxococcales bacterium]|nr:hypothetical protein [Myxococcales bacterium]
MASQIVAPSLALASTVRHCCCDGGEHSVRKKCPCPACSKARAMGEGQDSMRSCGSHGSIATPVLVLAAVSPSIQHVTVTAFALRVAPAQPNAPPFRSVEVPTPPPLC